MIANSIIEFSLKYLDIPRMLLNSIQRKRLLKKIGYFCTSCQHHYDVKQRLYTVNEKQVPQTRYKLLKIGVDSFIVV